MLNRDLKEVESEEEELYQENILDHYKHPHNKREIVDCTVKEHDLNPLCGDEITLYLIVEDDVIVDVAFTGQGCAISQAAISMLTDTLKGKSVKDAYKIESQDIMILLGIKISHTRMKCALLSLKVLQQALQTMDTMNTMNTMNTNVLGGGI